MPIWNAGKSIRAAPSRGRTCWKSRSSVSKSGSASFLRSSSSLMVPGDDAPARRPWRRTRRAGWAFSREKTPAGFRAGWRKDSARKAARPVVARGVPRRTCEGAVSAHHPPRPPFEVPSRAMSTGLDASAYRLLPDEVLRLVFASFEDPATLVRCEGHVHVVATCDRGSGRPADEPVRRALARFLARSFPPRASSVFAPARRPRRRFHPRRARLLAKARDCACRG